LPEPDELSERNTQMIFETVARRMSVDECVAKLLRNREFYTASDGGVTFSGGEAMIQVAFVSECLKRLKDNGVHTTVDTAGNVPWAYFTKVLDHTDLFLYDIKSCDERLHRQGTGAGSKRILDNARRLAEADRPMWVRLVVIPGWNDVATDLEERLRFTASLGDAVKRVDLLAYHSLGVGKYLRLGLDYPLPGMPRLDERLIEEAMALGTDLGLNMHYEPGVHA